MLIDVSFFSVPATGVMAPPRSLDASNPQMAALFSARPPAVSALGAATAPTAAAIALEEQRHDILFAIHFKPTDQGRWALELAEKALRAQYPLCEIVRKHGYEAKVICSVTLMSVDGRTFNSRVRVDIRLLLYLHAPGHSQQE